MNNEENKEVLNPVGSVNNGVVNPAPVVNTPVQPETLQQPNVVPQAAPQVVVNQAQTQPNVVPQQPAAPQPAKVPTTEEPRKGGKFRIFLLILLFILLGAMIYYLPEITQYVDNMNKAPTKEILSGTLVCKYKNETKTSTKEIEAKFEYKEELLKKVEISTLTTNEDSEKLKTIMTRCEEIEKEVLSLKGIEVKCSNSEGQVVQLEKINYETFDPSTLTDAFSEAGGYYPKFDFNEKIDNVNKEMVKSSYSCNKVE